MADELDGMATFVAVAEAKGFRAASNRLGVTHSAVSQAVRRLEKFCSPFPGYYLYYPQRRQASRSLRALIDYLQEWRRSSRSSKRRRT